MMLKALTILAHILLCTETSIVYVGQLVYCIAGIFRGGGANFRDFRNGENP